MNSYDALMYRSLVNGTWSPINDIFAQNSGASEFTVRNSIVAGRDGKLHVLLRQTTNIGYFHAPSDKAWSANAWSALRSVGSGYYNGLAMDNRGVLHVVETKAVTDDPQKPRKNCPDCANLFYRSSSNGGGLWSRPINLSESFEGADRPVIKIDTLDRIHVVWSEGFDWYAGKGMPTTGVYRRSDDGGKTWTTPAIFSLPDDTLSQVTLTLIGEGNPLVIYRGIVSNKLFFQRSIDSGTSWSSPQEIPSVLARGASESTLDNYSVVTDSANHVHLLMTGFLANATEQTYPSLFHLSWDGAAWSPPKIVMAENLYPEWPRLAIFGGNQLHVVWFTRKEQFTERRDYRIWYSGMQLTVPTATALPLFTPTPTAAPTSTSQPPTPTPTPTPLAAAALNAPPLTGPPTWELSGLTVVVIALLPLVGLLALGLGIVRLRHRHRS
jgi:hypothetical protein